MPSPSKSPCSAVSDAMCPLPAPKMSVSATAGGRRVEVEVESSQPRGVVEDVSRARVGAALRCTVAHDVADEEFGTAVCVVVEPAEDLLAEAHVAGGSVDAGPGSEALGDLEFETRPPRPGEVVVPGDEERSIGCTAAAVDGLR